MIDVIKNVDLFSHVSEYDAVLIGTNISYSMRHGFQRKVAINYPYVYEANISTKYGDINKMGQILECKQQDLPTFIICYINKTFNTRPDKIKDYLDYDALINCVKLINVLYKGKKLASTMIGCSRFDGNGNKDKVLDIFKENAKSFDITLYDYEQKSKDEMYKELLEKEHKIKEKDINLYYKVVAERKKKEELLKKINGRAKF